MEPPRGSETITVKFGLRIWNRDAIPQNRVSGCTSVDEKLTKYIKNRVSGCTSVDEKLTKYIKNRISGCTSVDEKLTKYIKNHVAVTRQKNIFEIIVVVSKKVVFLPRFLTE